MDNEADDKNGCRVRQIGRSMSRLKREAVAEFHTLKSLTQVKGLLRKLSEPRAKKIEARGIGGGGGGQGAGAGV